MRSASKTHFYRSAGACPPRSLHGEGNPLACADGMRGPSPYVKGRHFSHRSAGACPPRSLHGAGNPLASACGIRGPKPYVKGRRFFHRSAGAYHRDVERDMKAPQLIGIRRSRTTVINTVLSGPEVPPTVETGRSLLPGIETGLGRRDIPVPICTGVSPPVHRAPRSLLLMCCSAFRSTSSLL